MKLDNKKQYEIACILVLGLFQKELLTIAEYDKTILLLKQKFNILE